MKSVKGNLVCGSKRIASIRILWSEICNVSKHMGAETVQCRLEIITYPRSVAS